MSIPSVEFLVSLAAKGTILLLVTTAAAALAHRARASMRHALWCAGLTGLLLVPVLSVGLPRWEVVSLPPLVQLSSVPAAARPATSSPVAPNRHETTAPATPIASGAPAPAPLAQATATVASRTAPAARFDLARTIVLVWFAGAVLALGWVLFGHLRVRGMVRISRAELSPEWRESIAEAESLALGRTPVQFRETASAMPMAAGVFAPVILLPASGSEWSRAHRRDVVIHELAHVRRRDCLTHLGIRAACAVHWFNPLVWLAARQARVEREHACDDAVLAAGALPSSYAQALLETARQAPAAWATAAAGLTMARPSHLANRLLAVLDTRRRRGRLGRMAFGAASFGTLALLAPVAALAPARAAAPDPIIASDPTLSIPVPPARTPPAGTPLRTAGAVLPDRRESSPLQGSSIICPYNRHGTHRSVRLTGSVTISGFGSTNDGKGDSYTAWTGADCSVIIHIQGEPSFTADETDVAGFRESGRITFTVSEGATERVYDVRGSGTSVTRSYRVERDEQPIDDSTHRWIASLIVQYVRQSGYQAEARAIRILKADGMPGLLREIDAIQSDYARGRYYRAVLPSRQSGSEASALLDHARAGVESDYEKGRVLAAVPARLLGEVPVRTSYLALSRSIESDYEKANALLAISVGSLDPASSQTALETAATLTSDYERSRVLVAVSKSVPSGRDLDPLYFDALQGVESDYEKARVLTVYSQHAGLSEAGLGRLYAAAARITSSNDLSNLLLATVASPGAVTARCDGYLTAAAKIDSDYDKARALSGLFGAGALSQACARRSAEVANTIESDNDHARVLIDYASRGFLTEATRTDFFRSAAGIESSYERRRVLTAVLSRGALAESILADLLENAAGIQSDNDLATVLIAAAGTGQVNATLRPIYLRAAGKLASDYERRRALTAISAR